MTASVFLAGGGTGGHLYPGLALARVLAREYHLEPRFIHGGLSIAGRVLENSGFPSHRRPVGTSRFPPRVGLGEWRWVRQLYREHRPRAVIGLGGGASVIPGLVAIRLGIPLFLLEQNRVLGRANRLLQLWARRIFLSWPRTRGGVWLRRRALRLGCPVRESFVASPLPRGPVELLVLGGSQGATEINEMMRAAMPFLADGPRDLRIIHICGPGRASDLSRDYASHGVLAEVFDFLDDPASVLKRASLVLARAGGSTLAELTAVGRGSLLVPYPYHRDRQQFHNASVLVEAGAAEVLSADAESLVKRLRELATDRESLERLAENAKKLGVPAAAARIAEVVSTHLGEVPDGSTIHQLV